MKRCPACATVFAQGGEFCSMDGTRLVPLAAAPLGGPDGGAEPGEGTHHTLVSGSLGRREPRPTVPLHRVTGDLDVSALTLALAKGDSGLVGHVIAERYRVEEPIGRGGMGVVYRAVHELLDRPVAVKLLRPQFLSDDRAVQRFMREAQAMARIEHPNAVTIHDFGIMADGAAYLVMEFVEGETLRSVLGRARALPLEDAVAITQQICEAVDAAHRQGVVHRDLKPENIMFKRTEEGAIVKVCDFGLAKLVDRVVGALGEEITSSNDLFGTPAYMAPEFYEGDEIDARADVYSIGVVLYEILAGGPPFQGTVQSIMSGHLFKEPPPIAGTGPDVHPAVDRVIRKALRKAPAERFQSPLDLAQALRDAASTALGYETVAVPELSARPITTGALASELGTSGGLSAERAPSGEVDSEEQETIGRPVATPAETPATLPQLGEVAEPVRTRRRPLAAAGSVAAAVALGGLVLAGSRVVGPAEPAAPPAPAAVASAPPAAQPAPVPPAPEPHPPAERREPEPRASAASDPFDRKVDEAEPSRARAVVAPRSRPERASDARAERTAEPRKGGAADRRDADKAAEKKGDDKKKRRKWWNPFSW